MSERQEDQEPFHAQLRAVTQSKARYIVALAAFAAAVLFRYVLADRLGETVPYLPFFPAIMVAAWYGGLGPGVLITMLSSAVAMYWLLPPPGMAVSSPADQLSLATFVIIGLFISWLNGRLHVAEQAHQSAVATAMERAERLDAILAMTLDGIIVIDAKGRIEAFNRGAQDLFGYPRGGSARAECQHPDAVARPRTARRVSGAIPHNW